LNSVTREYVERTVRDAELAAAVQAAPLPPVFDECYRRILLPRPIIAPHDRVARFADDLAKVFRLLVSLPRRLFDGDLALYCAAVGITSDLTALMSAGATGSPPLFGRSDAYDDGSELKLLEFNVGTELGGMDFAELNKALLRVPAFAAFAQEYGLGYVDTAQLVADELDKLGRPVATGDRVVVVLLETTGGIAAHQNYRAVQEAMIGYGLDFRLGEVQQVKHRNGRLELDGTPVDVALRFYAAGEILQCPDGASALDPIRRAVDAGGTVLFTGLENSLYNTKGGLALLSDEAHRGAFSPEERAVIDRVIPWTRLLVPDAALLWHCREEREDLIIKPSVGWGAAGAVMGRTVHADDWDAALNEHAGHGYVVQRVVTPVAEPVFDPAAGTVEDWQVNWGVFVTGSGYAGSFQRGLRPVDGRVITFGNRGTRGTTLFTY